MPRIIVNADDSARVNRARWDALASRPGTGHDDYYDVPGFLAGGTSLTDP